MEQNQKYKQSLLLIPIFLFLCGIITSEKNLYRLNDSDLSFDLLVFLGKGFSVIL